MKRWARTAALTLVAAAAAGGAVAAAVVWFGWYDVTATSPHTTPVHHLLDTALNRAVKTRSAGIEAPDLANAERIQNGSRLYRAHCVQCHGGPGVAPEAYALGMNPAPAALVATARMRTAAEVFWITRQGIKMTGMPAWQYRLTDDEIWDVVAFLRVLPALSAEDYRRDGAGLPPEVPRRTAQPAVRVGDARAGRDALQQYLCVTCHAIPGVPGAWNYVGPALDQMGEQPYIAGVLPNTPENMEGWLRSPGSVKPGTAMPDLGVSEQDAKDIAAFLRTLPDGP